MSEEVKAYEPQPRGAARIAGIDLASFDTRLKDCEAFFQKHVDETDYRNFDWYLQRGQLRFAVGDDIYEVIDDAFMAARCLHERHAMHLELKPPEMFMTRRITPVELGIVSGMPMLTLEFSATFGLPLMMIMSQTAPEDIQSEANLITSYFRRGFCADYYELAGLSALIYAGVIAALGRGFDDEAILGLNTYAKARDSLRGMPPESLLPKLKRYDALNTALACICSGSFELIPEIVAPLADAFLEEQEKRNASNYFAPSKMPVPKYYDLSILTIIALTALRETALDFPKEGAIAQYNAFTRGFTEMPERRIEIPGLNEESRRILEQAGVDPDQLAQNYVDDGFRSEKEESEARAKEIFEEKQRQVQRAVQKRIAQGIAQEEAHTSVEPERYVHEELKLDDEKVEATGRFASFFDDDERDEEAEKRARLYDGDDDDTHRDNDAGKNFSSFFEKHDDTDNLIRETIESAEESYTDDGKRYDNFFENLNPSITAPFEDDDKKPTRDDGVKGFTNGFFADDAPPSELAMTAEQNEEIKQSNASNKVEIKPEDSTDSEEKKQKPPSASRFTDTFFADEKGPKPKLDMGLIDSDSDSESNPKSTNKLETSNADRDYAKIFTETAPAASTALKMSVDDLVDQGLNTTHKELDPIAEERRKNAQALREAQIRELEEAQAQKLRAEEAAKEANKLRLQADKDEKELPKLESFDERAARLIREKQEAIREKALKEREEAQRELEALKAQGVQRPKIEKLQLKPDAPRDADDIVEKVGLDDLVIPGFVYTDLDMIHANIAEKEDLDEDFDMHAALLEQRVKEEQETSNADIKTEISVEDEDFDMHAALAKQRQHEATLREKDEAKAVEVTQNEDFDMHAALEKSKKQNK